MTNMFHTTNCLMKAGFSEQIYIADFFLHLNDLNVKLQGCGKTFDVTFGYITAFENKLVVSMRDVDGERS